MIGKIDLSGEWKLCLDKDCKGKNLVFDDTINMPNTTSNAQKGVYNSKREEGFLTDTYLLEGWAWFSKEIDFNKLECKNLKLFLERTRITTVYIDGKKIGTQESLCTPHIYDLNEYIDTGVHEVRICVSNVNYKTKGGHLTSPDTQSNWNGITGRMELIGYNEAYVENVMVWPDISNKTCRITADVFGSETGSVSVSAESFNSDTAHKPDVQNFDFNGGKLDIAYKMGDNCLLWSEHTPNLYKLSICLDGDVSTHIVGMRDFKTDGGKFTVNGRKTFLRGKHDGMIFPKTAYAPCDVDEWIRVMKISKSFGMNHYRFHTCCPPEAAFIAADMLGIYMEPQLPFWGTIYTEGEGGYNKEELDFLTSEGFAILKAYGNHPSYCMMSMGNELWGSKEKLNEIIGNYKAFDNRHLYTQGSNNFQWFPNVVENDDFFVGVRLANDRLIRGSYAMCDAPLGHIQTDKPAANHDYDGAVSPAKKASATETSADGTVQIQYGTTMKTVKASDADADFIPKVPIVTHEIGQFETYPDFREIEKYTGSLKAKNFEIFRERLDEKGLLPLAEDYFKCSGQLAKACYKEEMEAVFRSRLLGGFQILDIQDFSGQGTALVGMLDAFMDNKGIITDEEWREFCNDVVALARFDKYTFVSGEEFNAHTELVYYRPSNYNGKLLWNICDSAGKMIGSGEFTVSVCGQNYIDLGEIKVKMPEVSKVTNVTLTLVLEGTDVKNHYDLAVIPSVDNVDLAGAYIFENTESEEAVRLLEQGRTILIVPDLEKLENSIEGFYCQDFWCYHMFALISRMMEKPEPVGTMGLLINNEHPALSQFGSEKYSTPIWWDIVQNSRSEIIDDCPEGKNVIVRTIDNFERNHNLAMLYEYSKLNGKVVVCNCDFDKLAETPEGRLFIKSIVDYVRN